MTTSTVVDRDSLIAEAPTTTAQSNQPERTAAWHEAYPAPRSLEHLKHISVQEVAQWYADPNQQPGKDFVVVDVRRADCEVGRYVTLLLWVDNVHVDIDPRGNQSTRAISSSRTLVFTAAPARHPPHRIPLQLVPRAWSTRGRLGC
jgi:hypothetical protein